MRTFDDFYLCENLLLLLKSLLKNEKIDVALKYSLMHNNIIEY